MTVDIKLPMERLTTLAKQLEVYLVCIKYCNDWGKDSWHLEFFPPNSVQWSLTVLDVGDLLTGHVITACIISSNGTQLVENPSSLGAFLKIPIKWSLCYGQDLWSPCDQRCTPSIPQCSHLHNPPIWTKTLLSLYARPIYYHPPVSNVWWHPDKEQRSDLETSHHW